MDDISAVHVTITHEYGKIRYITFVVVCVKHPRIRTKLKASTSDESWWREIDYVTPSARLSHHNALLHFWWQWSSEKRWSSKAELRRCLFPFGSSKSWLQNGSKVTPTSRTQPDFNNFDEYWFRILSIHAALVIIWVIAQSTADAVAADITSFVRLSDLQHCSHVLDQKCMIAQTFHVFGWSVGRLPHCLWSCNVRLKDGWKCWTKRGEYT